MGNEHHSINICCSKNDWILQHKILYLHSIYHQIQNKTIFHKPTSSHASLPSSFLHNRQEQTDATKDAGAQVLRHLAGARHSRQHWIRSWTMDPSDPTLRCGEGGRSRRSSRREVVQHRAMGPGTSKACGAVAKAGGAWLG